MSIENVFASTRPASLGIALQRRLRLLGAVLPHFPPAAMRKYSTIKPLRPEKAFWTRLLSICLPMELEGWRLDRLDDRHDALVKRLLRNLESIVYMDRAEVSEEFTSSPYPRFETLRHRMSHNSDEDEGPANDIIKLVKPNSPHTCSELFESLEELSKAIDDRSTMPPPEETKVISKSKPILSPILVNLLSTISKCLNCDCIKPHKAMLMLLTRQTLPKEGLHEFEVLLTRGRAENQWKKTTVTVKEDEPEPSIRIELPDSFDAYNEHNAPARVLTPISDLCRSIKTTHTTPLHLNIERGTLFQQTATGLEEEELLERESVTLSEGLFENATELDLNGKVCLALVLSYCLVDFCGEPWFPNGWTGNGISLLQSKQQLCLQPALLTCLSPTTERMQSSNVSRNLKLLFHGILLMEVFQQAPLPINQASIRGTDLDELRDLVRTEFDAMAWGVCERFSLSVKSCIEGIQSVQGSDQDDETFVRLFCQRVIAPLEADFTSLWGNKNPDEVISELKLPSVRRKRPPPPAPKPAHLILKQRASRVTTLSYRDTAPLKFFDAIDSPDPKHIAGAKRWFDRFDQADIQEQLPKRGKDKNNRIKIAILDTGINMENPWIQQKSGRIQCWPHQKACEDTDGHGTHVAYLLLRLAPHTHLRIAKVANSQLLRDVDIENIAKAIHHFATDDFNRVDIINISFGFPQFHEKLRPILAAIRVARQNNVLVFAAAGNEGGNQDMFWPARLHQTGDVICINASDSDGNASSFNPTEASKKRICTLGEAVPSCEKSNQQQVIHRSGTSFATPIAVAVAAIVLGFVDKVYATDGPEDLAKLEKRLRTKSGMERVLRATCTPTEEKIRSGFSYITPWFFLGIPERTRVHLIANELRSVAE